MKSSDRIKWLALAREALVLAGESPSQADEVINQITGDWRDINDDKEWAYEVMKRISESEQLEEVQ